MPILPDQRDSRLITIRRGGTLTDSHHRLLADWGLLCAEHVLQLFEEEHGDDTRPRDAITVGALGSGVRCACVMPIGLPLLLTPQLGIP